MSHQHACVRVRRRRIVPPSFATPLLPPPADRGYRAAPPRRPVHTTAPVSSPSSSPPLPLAVQICSNGIIYLLIDSINLMEEQRSQEYDKCLLDCMFAVTAWWSLTRVVDDMMSKLNIIIESLIIWCISWMDPLQCSVSVFGLMYVGDRYISSSNVGRCRWELSIMWSASHWHGLRTLIRICSSSCA